MSTYNFRIRAVDNLGAFADRDFSINVRNTSAERIVAVNGSFAMSSPDGETWTQRASVGGTHVVHGDGVWVVAGPHSVPTTARPANTYMASRDAVNWQAIPNPGGCTDATLRFAYAGGRWVMVGQNSSSSNFLCYTTNDPTDGASWVRSTGAVAGSTHKIHSITFGGDNWLIGVSSTNQSANVVRSNNLEAFAPLVVSGMSALVATYVSYFNGTYFAMRHNTGILSTSKDLTSWSYRTLSLPSGNGLGGPFRYSNGRIVMPLAMTSQNQALTSCLTSDDGGGAWQSRSIGSYPIYGALYKASITSFNGKWYMASEWAGSTASFRTSPDGINWTAYNPSSWNGTAYSFYDIAAISRT